VNQPTICNPKFKIELALLVFIILLAAFLRLYRLDSLPPGLTHDEADTGHFVAAVWRGEPSNVRAPYGYVYEPFTQYSGALFMALFGPNYFALRVHSAFWGMVLLIFAYLWVRRTFGAAAGLGSAAMIATSYWTLSNSRFALNSEPAPALFTGAVYFLWRALKGSEHSRGEWWTWGLFALCLTGSLYVYEAARAAAVTFASFLIYLALFDRQYLRRHGAWLIGALALAGALAAPHLLDPSAWGRSATLSGPLQAAAQGNWQPLLTNVISTLGTFSFSGDSFVTYNLPGRPIFDPAASLFFYGGIALCWRHWKQPAYAFTLMWVLTGISPSLAIGEWTSTLHSKAAEAPILALPALCAAQVGRWISVRFGLRWSRAFTASCTMWLAVIAASTGYDYFVRWGQSPATRAAYFHNLATVTDYVNGTNYSGAVALSSPFPDLPLDPFIADMRLRRSDLDLRWFNAQRAIVFPDAARSLLIVPPNTPLNPLLATRLDLQRIERVNLRPDDVDPYFDVFEWNPQAALARFTSSGKTITAGEKTITLPVSLGAVELIGYELPAQLKPGETLTLLTAWRIRDPAALGPPPPHDYCHVAVIFAHVLDANNVIISQEDRLDAPAWNWHTGDAFVQAHNLTVPAKSSAPYRLEVGIYIRQNMTRLPVLLNGIGVDDRMLISK